MWQMYHEHGHFWGMHWIWWVLWIILIICIFVTPWAIPGERKKKDSPLDILRKRYAAGELTTEEYEKRKKILDEDVKKK